MILPSSALPRTHLIIMIVMLFQVRIITGEPFMFDILHRVIEPYLIASIEIDSRDAFWEHTDDLSSACDNSICGPLFLMYDMHNNAEKKELCYPVIRQVNNEHVGTKIIGQCEVYSMFYFGRHSELDEMILSFLSSLDNRIDRSDIFIKEIYHEFYPDNEEENVTEIQVLFPLERE